MRDPKSLDYLLLATLALIWASAFFNIRIATYSFGPITAGYQQSDIQAGGVGGNGQIVDAWGIAFNVNDNMSISYGEREVEFDKPSATNVTEKGEGIAVSYTMGSMKIAGNRNEVTDNDGTAASNDSMTEIAVSFAF